MNQGGSDRRRRVDLGNAGGAAAYDFAIAETPFDLGTVNPELLLTREFSEPVAIGTHVDPLIRAPRKPIQRRSQSGTCHRG